MRQSVKKEILIIACFGCVPRRFWLRYVVGNVVGRNIVKVLHMQHRAQLQVEHVSTETAAEDLVLVDLDVVSRLLAALQHSQAIATRLLLSGSHLRNLDLTMIIFNGFTS